MRTLTRVFFFLFYRSVDGFKKSNDHIEVNSLDFTSHSEYPYQTPTEPNPHTLGSPANQAIIATTSSNKMLVSSTSALPENSFFEVSVPQSLSTNLNSCGVFNNYLFRQDPTTGHLSLVPVQVRAPESLPGLDINLSLVPQPLQGLIAVRENSDGSFVNCLNVPVRPEAQDHGLPTSYFNGSSIMSDSSMEHRVLSTHCGRTTSERQGDKQSPFESVPPKVHPALKEVIDLLKGEFSFDGHLDNGHEDIAMGMCF